MDIINLVSWLTGPAASTLTRNLIFQCEFCEYAWGEYIGGIKSWYFNHESAWIEWKCWCTKSFRVLKLTTINSYYKSNIPILIFIKKPKNLSILPNLIPFNHWLPSQLLKNQKCIYHSLHKSCLYIKITLAPNMIYVMSGKYIFDFSIVDLAAND